MSAEDYMKMLQTTQGLGGSLGSLGVPVTTMEAAVRDKEKPTAIATAVARCVDTISTISREINVLEKKLEPVLQRPTPQPTPENLKRESTGVSFADFIHTIGDDLESIQARLHDIQKRIEI